MSIFCLSLHHRWFCYLSSACYVYQRMPMDLRTNPAIWQSYINAILSYISDRSRYVANMADLLLHSPRHSHWKYLEDLLKALLKSVLKIPPKKCWLFTTELKSVGNTIFIKDKRISIKPLKTRLKATQKRLHVICRSGKLFEYVFQIYRSFSNLYMMWQVKVDLSYGLKHI